MMRSWPELSQCKSPVGYSLRVMRRGIAGVSDVRCMLYLLLALRDTVQRQHENPLMRKSSTVSPAEDGTEVQRAILGFGAAVFAALFFTGAVFYFRREQPNPYDEKAHTRAARPRLLLPHSKLMFGQEPG
eukprot:6203828-Pleurochrysis_carterae.AAC.4